MKKNVFIKALVAITLVGGLNACDDKKELDDEPIVENPIENIVSNPIENDEAAFALLNSAWRPYQTLSSTFTSLIDTPVDGYTSFLGKEDDDCTFAAQIKIEYTNLYPRKTFNALYKSIGIVNDAINKINGSTGVTAAGKTQAIAQAKFQRALYYSYLVQLWGEVPLLLETGGDEHARNSIAEVYSQVVKDLKEAAAVLPAGNGLSSPVNPTKGAANTLLARVYLAWGNNPLTQAQVDAIKDSRTDPAVSYTSALLDSAIVYADKVINSSLYSLLPDFRNLWGRANESKGPEQIFTIHHDGDGIDQQGNHQAHCASHNPWNEDEPPHIQPAHTYDWWPDDDPRKAFSVLTELTDPVTDSLHIYNWPHSLPHNGKGVDRSYPNSEYLTQLTND
ncbi:MAG: RagB/SusD family nutrient uptake outer membrane protein, partial [Dysgonamonadaceae bacterium]|nr:RagB/SusD family nutrient uptake outer membrane protein [Dysgonamonadaceae bacterium]